MIADTETLSTIAQHWAAREAEHHTVNRLRLEAWAQRYPYDLVAVPAPCQPPKWPALLCSRPPVGNITKLPAKARR